MASQTPAQRKASARKAAATRKRNATAQKARGTRSAATRTASSGAATAQEGAKAGVLSTKVLAQQAERAVMIPVGVMLEARDSVVEAAKPFAKRTSA